jgi:hypothetical protein
MRRIGTDDMEAQLLDRTYLCGKIVAICGPNGTLLSSSYLDRLSATSDDRDCGIYPRLYPR